MTHVKGQHASHAKGTHIANETIRSNVNMYAGVWVGSPHHTPEGGGFKAHNTLTQHLPTHN